MGPSHARRVHWLRGGLLSGLAFAALTLAMPLEAAGPAQPPGEREAWRQQVWASELAFARSMADRDHAAFVAHLDPEALFFGRQLLRGRDAVAQGWKPFFDGPQAPFSWQPDQVEVLDSGQLALSTGPVRNARGEVIARFNSIWRRQPDGRWLVVFDKGSPPDPAPPPAPTKP